MYKDKKRIVLMLFLMALVSYLDRVNIATAAPAMMHALAIGPQDFGLVMGAFSVGYAVIQIPGGYLADRFGPKPVIVVCVLLWSLLTFSISLATSTGALMALRFVFGMCEGAAMPAFYRQIGDSFEARERSRAMSIAGSGVALGPALAAPTVSWILASSSWESVFFVTAIPGFLLAVAMLLFMPKPNGSANPSGFHAGPAAQSLADWKRILFSGKTWLLLLGWFGFNASFWGYLGWMPSYLVLDRHVDLKHLGLGASVPYLCGAVGMLIFGALGSTWMASRRGLLIAAAMIATAAAMFVTFEATSLFSTIACLSVAAVFLYGALGPFGGLALDLAPEKLRGSFMGFIYTGGQIGGAVSPAVVGYLVKQSGSFAAGFAFIEISLLVSALGFGGVWWLQASGNRKSARTAPSQVAYEEKSQ
jgi:sugar phosphate permease